MTTAIKVTPATPPPLVGTGQWVWRDDTKMLEFTGSSNIVFREAVSSRQHRKLKVADKTKRERTPMTSVPRAKQPGLSTKLAARPLMGPATNSFREKHNKLPEVITLQDVKAVAISRLQKQGLISSSLTSSPLVDNIITRTLQFFHYYFILEETRRPKPMMVLTPPLSEKSAEEIEKERQDEQKLTESHKRLFAVYSSFLLGIFSEEVHHLSGGKLRYSKTREDREFYESLYQMLIHCTLINFEAGDPDVITTEMGRLFRSEFFNMNKREQCQKELEAKYPNYFKLKGLNDFNSGPSPAEYRRLRNNRHPFGTAITKQSPIVEGMLRYSPEQNTPSESPSIQESDEGSDMQCNGIGIIGKPIRDYDLTTLKKLDEKEKKELEMEENLSSRAASASSTRGNI